MPSQSFFGVDWNDALNAEEVNYYSSLPTLPYGSSPPPSSSSGNNSPPSVTIEKIPRIIHQTWKTTLLPTKWAKLTSQCKSLHPDYEYKLWTDESSIEFIREHYNWFLPTFMNYKLDIQRADVIRYFVLHKYGGVYMDLDIGGWFLSISSLSLVSSKQARALISEQSLPNKQVTSRRDKGLTVIFLNPILTIYQHYTIHTAILHWPSLPPNSSSFSPSNMLFPHFANLGCPFHSPPNLGWASVYSGHPILSPCGRWWTR